MELVHFTCPEGNFGDDLNAWIWDRLIPGWQGWDSDVVLLGVGTLINAQRVAQLAGKRVLVLGTGVGYGSPTSRSMLENWDIRALRGPNSARLLGMPEDIGLIDPAVMIADFSEFKDPTKSERPIFIPHHQSINICNWEKVCHRLGISYISPCGDAKSVIRSISSSPLVIAESMHAAIFAEAFRVPWVPVSIGRQFNSMKWTDVFEAARLQPIIHPLLQGVDRVSAIFSLPRGRRIQRRVWNFTKRFGMTKALEEALNTRPFLGDITELERRKRDYRRILDNVRNDYA